MILNVAVGNLDVSIAWFFKALSLAELSVIKLAMFTVISGSASGVVIVSSMIIREPFTSGVLPTTVFPPTPTSSSLMRKPAKDVPQTFS